MRFETVKINDLTPYLNNARKHSEKQIKQLQKSIKEFGFLNPVIIDATNGIIAGHGRVAAAIKLKIKEVPCIRAEHLTEVQKQAYILADNKLALNSEWDDTILQSELQALKELQFDFETIGFDEIGLEDPQEAIVEKNRTGAKELDPDDFSQFDNKCPKCGFEFDNKKE